MTKLAASVFLVLTITLCTAGESSGGAVFAKEIAPFLSAHCIKCHGPEKQKGKLRLDSLDGNREHETMLLMRVRDQIRDGLMPPEESPQPPAADAKRVIAVLTSLLPKQEFTADQLPNKGNLVPHELLFGNPATAVGFTPSRLWRLNSESYVNMMNTAARGKASNLGLVKPFTLIPDRGLNDYAALYSMDEPTTEILVRNAALVVEKQCAFEITDGTFKIKNDAVREFASLMDPSCQVTPAQVVAAAQQQFTAVLGRPPSAEQLARYEALYNKCAAKGDRQTAIKTVLQAVLLNAGAIYRSELGAEPDSSGRRMLAPQELADAISLALGNKRIQSIASAASKGELQTREQLAAKIRAVLDGADKNGDTSRVPGFFRQYFDYARATEIFKTERFPFQEFANEWEQLAGRNSQKDETIRGAVHSAASLVADTDRLIQYVLEQDKDVLRTLLTTDLMFVNARMIQDKQTREFVMKQAFERNPNNHRGVIGPQYVYGFMEWPEKQPAKAPVDKPRLGILMQPAWLVAHSTNFENDPVRRGRWIRERLLGQAVPDLPIDVAAQVPDEPHHTFRTRLQVTREARCFKCHQWMDNLGLPFEQFDHYGVFRKTELVEDKAASRQKTHKNGDPVKVFVSEKLDTTGLVALTGDPQLDGKVNDPYELVRKLAESTRVRQVFVRHAFRYFLGRNEAVSDARTLQEADRAYVESGGSFKALIISLLTSDSFLYRSNQALAKN
ncbi:MAG TPA: DUF1588 domain-containing protein [Planctomycetota bacterium]|nr:DUF1588 domain-containing protein [Planctomycetota bacterium]